MHSFCKQFLFSICSLQPLIIKIKTLEACEAMLKFLFEPTKMSDLFKNEKEYVRTIFQLNKKVRELEEEMKYVKKQSSILFKKKKLISALSRMDVAHLEGIKLISERGNGRVEVGGGGVVEEGEEEEEAQTFSPVPIIITPHSSKEGLLLSATPLRPARTYSSQTSCQSVQVAIPPPNLSLPPPPPPLPPLPQFKPLNIKIGKSKEGEKKKGEEGKRMVIDLNALKSVKLKSSLDRVNQPPLSSSKPQQPRMPTLSEITNVRLRKNTLSQPAKSKANYDGNNPAKSPPFKFQLKKVTVERSPGGTPLKRNHTTQNKGKETENNPPLLSNNPPLPSNLDSPPSTPIQFKSASRNNNSPNLVTKRMRNI